MNVLAADVGGTHFTMSITDTNTLRTLFKERTYTQNVRSVEKHINDFLTVAKREGYAPTHACFAVAGPVQGLPGRRTARLTNAPLVFDEAKIRKKTGLRTLIINDFEAIGYAVNALEKGDTKTIRAGKPVVGSPLVLVGAGTGLGKAFLFFDARTQKYVPHAGEGGHAPLPVESDEELRLVTFLKHQKLGATYQNVLSGRGLELLYAFFTHEKKDAERIMQENEAHARDTRHVFKKYYARFAQTAVLDVLAGGVYIAGGIAAKNPGLFDKQFLHEFDKNWHVHNLLAKTPITLITNYDISLRGAAIALREVS